MLQHCLLQSIPHVLSKLPASLDETYERLLREIGTANQHFAYRLLQFLAVAIRPLRVEELAEIIALDFDVAKEGIPELKEDWRSKNQREAILLTCSSLISVVKDGSHHVVQFSHFSVKEFLTSDQLATSSAISYFHILPEPAHTVIAKGCLGVLLQSSNGVGDAEAKVTLPWSIMPLRTGWSMPGSRRCRYTYKLGCDVSLTWNCRISRRGSAV